ncbi:hypothetical protein DFP93_101234 [Aneurinibacillus soli]|uniref:Uncharacterized protein n=1 Tax=Aneurinibacillus soli TaxID=1500254 RepID=A0A0U5BJ00_9BACL|nr:hypothetical protein [Aneurinibacillus soli]PYE64209.1 hypothetical protein DFP93_101234 [Aneurinibacillus soli]BAU28158.1 hypothetical protein CB4_02332 [Aneurinibacillus soli]
MTQIGNPKKVIIKGVGALMGSYEVPNPDKTSAQKTIRRALTLGTLQSLKIDFNVEMEDIFGGDSSFPLDQMVKSKMIEISATEAKFDMNSVSLLMGSPIREKENNDYLWEVGRLVKVVAGTAGDPSTATITNQAITGASGTITALDVNVTLQESNTQLEFEGVATSITDVPAAGKFKVWVPTSGTVGTYDSVILLEPSITENVYVSYRRKMAPDDELQVMNMFKNDLPFPISVVHTGAYVKDGRFHGVQTELYKCIAKGQFSLDFQRANASTNALSLKIVDPELPCGLIGTMKKFVTTPPAC